MTGDGHSRGEISGAVRPGALSALLLDLARAPGSGTDGERWEAGLHAGAVVGRFELVRELGRGGFGVVWEASDRELGRRVAFKAVRAGAARDLREERLLREGEAAARLSHPNIVTLFDAGRSEHGPYLVLELLEGETLAERLAQGTLTVREALRIAVAVAKGLAHAHGHGVVHRDLKPGNVFLCSGGQVKILDFGLAHAFGRKRVDGGTPAYMAPEQSDGSPEDERTDVWALGALLFEMLMGRPAFPDGRVGKAPQLDVSWIPGLGDLLAMMLAERPRERPRDAGDVASTLASFALQAERVPAVAGGEVRARGKVKLPVATIAAGVGAVALISTALAVRWAASPAPAAAENGRLLVAVADVVNETGERDLDVLSGLLVTSLEQSRRLSVMTQARVLDLAIRAGRKDAVRVDETIGREVGQAQAVRALLLPAVRRLGTAYSLELRAIDPVRDEHMFTLSDRAASKEAILGLLDRLAERSRAELGAADTEGRGSRLELGQAMTRSIEAYQNYVAGLEGWLRDGQRAVALKDFGEALRLDGRFAAAHGALANLLSAYGRPDLAAPHWRAADEYLDAMPEKERLVLRMQRAHADPSLDHFSREDALRLANDVMRRFPDDKFVLLWAADAYEAFDVQDRREAALRRAVELDPAFLSAVADLVDALGDRAAEALETARRAVATRRSAASLSILALAMRAAGDDAGAAAAAREALGTEGGQTSLVARNACDTLHELGDDEQCIRLWTRNVADGPNEPERDFARFQLMNALAFAGRLREALALAAAAGDRDRAAPPTWLAGIHQIGRPRLDAPKAIEAARRIQHLQIRRNFLSWLGAAEEANRITTTLEGKGYEIVEKVNRCYALVRERRLDEAVDLMRAVRREIHRRNFSVSLYGAALLEAEVLLEAGRTTEAAEVRPSPLPCRCTDRLDHAMNLPRLALLRARAMERLGHRAEAVRELDGVIAFWRRADADLPLLLEAKAMLRRLTATSTASSPAAAPP